MNSPLLEKSLDLATKIVLFYKEYSKSRKDTTIAKQLLRSATSIGENINEAVYGNSKADFVSKLHIALKETGESIYWLTLLKRTNLFEYNYDALLSTAEEIKRMLIASIDTARKINDIPPNQNLPPLMRKGDLSLFHDSPGIKHLYIAEGVGNTQLDCDLIGAY